MTPAELLLASRGTTTGSTARVSPTTCPTTCPTTSPSPSLVDKSITESITESITGSITSRRPSPVRPCSIRLSWTIGLGGRLECSLDPHGLELRAALTFNPASSRPLRSSDSMHAAASIGHCEVLHFSTDDARQRSVMLRLANGQRATIEVMERGSDSEGSRYLVLTDLPAQLGFRGGTYVLSRIEVDE